MAGQPRRASQPAQNGNGKLPGSTATQAQVVAEELQRLEYLRTRSAIKQRASQHEDDHDYAAADESGEMASYKDYRKALDAYERRLKDETPPGAWRLAQKHLAEAAKQIA